MQTTLGLSITSTGVGWVLVEGREAEGSILDHDVADVTTNGGVTAHVAAAVRGALAIAEVSGHEVQSLGVTWTENVDAEAKALLDSLTELGYSDVVTARSAHAAHALARRIGRAVGCEKTAVCIIEPEAVTAVLADTDGGAARTSVTSGGGTTAGLIRWLTELFNRDDWKSEALFLIGSHDYLDVVTARVGATVPMKVFSSRELHKGLAHGAALASTTDVSDSSGGHDLTRGLSWVLSHRRELTALVTCVIALLAVGLVIPEQDSRATENPPAAHSPPAAPASVEVAPPSSPAESLATPPAIVAPPPASEPAVPAATVADRQPEEAIAPPPEATAPATAAPIAPPVAPPPPPPAPPPANPPPPPANPPPPPDPVQMVLSPLFSALP